MAWVVIGLYAVGMVFIFLYSLVQLSLLIRYRRHKNMDSKPAPVRVESWPAVLVQLPVYNERYVVERLIDAVCAFDYPRELLEIQVLDDSSDESFELAAARVSHWKNQGINISHISRPVRTGYKAGALQYGLEMSDAPYIAIFDADFIPESDFLRNTISKFTDENIGMVQTRWGHLNRNYSLLTQVQAFALDAHFTVEQMGRNAGHHFINFNGTAGVWRRQCILDAGGWSADTLTEDLDLSYRAQLKGWQFVFLQHTIAPAELPAEMNALKNQQYRWNKGAAECAMKHLSTVISRKSLPVSTRIHAFFHLLNSSVFIWIVLCAVLSMPLIAIKHMHPELKLIFHLGGLLMLSFVVLAIFYYTAFRVVQKERNRRTFLWLYPAFLSMSMGLSLHNARAVILGYFGHRTAFIRTPKWNITATGGTWFNKQYLSRNVSATTWIEGALALYFGLALFYGLAIGEWGFLPLHAMLSFGFLAVFIYSIKHAVQV
jgi:cellulose synthase/poly-beta-1,6-N-acetylglucosamine synthase-like glycosyltransferase